jgi:hypothetical protein
MKRFLLKLSCAFVAAVAFGSGHAAMIVGPWTPLFKGIEHSVNTNTPGIIPRLQAIHALRVDLTDPDISFETTPRVLTNYLSGVREVIGETCSDFLTGHGLQAALNANFFSPTDYYPPPGTFMDLHGIAINQGTNVSTANSAYAATLTFDKTNHPTFIPADYPPQSTTGVFNAISGDSAVLVNGLIRVTQNNNDVDPRTVYGLSADRKYLFMVTFDGRQPGYSDGASHYDCAYWLKLLGANDAVNFDGGGSTMLIVADSTGAPVMLNSSSAVADSGRERTVGGHFGIHAKPLPGFINDVQVIPDDTSAVIKWTTLQPADSEVFYGTTTDYELGSVSSPYSTNTHQLSLTSLTPATMYYFQVQAATEAQKYYSSNFVFTTTNYVTTNQIFDLSHPWKYWDESLDAVNWTATNYDDSAWNGPAPGVLWADTRATPNPAIQNEMTQMPGDPNTGFPFVTYYFRTTFVLTNAPMPGTSLAFSAYVDDGAAFYVNGVKGYLLRLADDATYNDIALAYPCSGDADCVDHFTISAESTTNLVVGTNVLAVEVHNYNVRSPDITFGLALSLVEPIKRDIQLQIGWASDKISLDWSAAAVLQSAPAVDGPWEDVTPAPASPVILQPTGDRLFYRLRRSP